MKILIIDDHALFREGLCYVLNKLGPSTEILEASDFSQATTIVSGNPDLDLVLLDLSIPGTDGFEGLRILSKNYPTLVVVIISASTERRNIQRALDLGAMGYVPKAMTSEDMLNAIQLVMSSGEIYIPNEMSVQNIIFPEQHESERTNLTPRQLEVLSLLVKGCSNKEIASSFNLTEATVKMHVTSILKSLGVKNRTQAVIAAEQLGLANI